MSLDRKAIPANKGFKASRVLKAILVSQARQVQWDHKGFKVYRVLKVILVNKGRQDRKESRASRDRKATQGSLAHKV